MIPTLAWIRRDMRLHDHAVLANAMARPSPVQPVFILDTAILARFRHKRDRRLVFIAETLCLLHRQLQLKRGGLLVLHGNAQVVIPKLSHALGDAPVIAAEDCEPPARARDASIAKAIGSSRFTHVLDHLLRHPADTLKDDGSPFKVFTPFAKKFMGQLSPAGYASFDYLDMGRYAVYGDSVARAGKAGLKPLDCSKGPQALLAAIGYEYAPDALWGPADAADRLKRFCRSRIVDYSAARDRMDKDATSQLSPYLRFGLLSIRECMREASAHEGEGAQTWIKELIWREFYANILYHFPHVVEQEFLAQYRTLDWSCDERHLSAFREGRTGYPIIDAAMRQLLETGWMHNRARMIVASFACKDLQLDWRLGEEHFAQYLMDYDLASNNGGWQWAASVGTDAQPYFRVFNPLLQSKKFDPDGSYIRRYVPELSHMRGPDIHAPSGLLRPRDYPEPVVDHAIAKEAAIAMFKRTSATLP